MFMYFDRTEFIKLFDSLTRDPDNPRSFLYSLVKGGLCFEFLIFSHDELIFVDLYNEYTRKHLFNLAVDFIQKIVCKDHVLSFYGGIETSENLVFTAHFDKNQLFFKNSAYNKLHSIDPIKGYYIMTPKNRTSVFEKK